MTYTNNTAADIPFLYLEPFRNYVVRSTIPPGMLLVGDTHDLPGQIVVFTDPRFEGVMFIFTLGNFSQLTVTQNPERADEGGSRRASDTETQEDTQFVPPSEEL